MLSYVMYVIQNNVCVCVFFFCVPHFFQGSGQMPHPTNRGSGGGSGVHGRNQTDSTQPSHTYKSSSGNKSVVELVPKGHKC